MDPLLSDCEYPCHCRAGEGVRRCSTIDALLLRGKSVLSHHGVLTEHQLKEAQYHNSWRYLYITIERGRATHAEHQSRIHIFASVEFRLTPWASENVG